MGISFSKRWLMIGRYILLTNVGAPVARGELTWPMWGSPIFENLFAMDKAYSLPRCSMYGIFTYKTVSFIGSMLVNIAYMEHMG